NRSTIQHKRRSVSSMLRPATALHSFPTRRSSDLWQGSWSSLQTRGQDMIDCMALLKPDAMTGHWEFTYGTERVKQAVDGLGFPRSEEHTSELQSRFDLVCRLLLEKKKKSKRNKIN